MAENHRLVTRSPFSLQSLCRLVLMPGFRISSFAPRPFTSEAFQLLGHAAKLNCLKKVYLVNIDSLDFNSVEKADLENFLKIVKFNINVSRVKSIEKLFSAADGVVPFGEEEPCRHHHRQTCTKCDRGQCRDFLCFCQPFWTPANHHGRDYSDCTCRKRGLHMSFEGINFSPAGVRGLVNFIKNVTQVQLGAYSVKFKWQHLHFDIETLKAEIGSLSNTTCKKIEFRGNWKTTDCEEKASHVTPDIVKVLAENLGWNYMICDVGLQIWDPRYRYSTICHCRDKENITCQDE